MIFDSEAEWSFGILEKKIKEKPTKKVKTKVQHKFKVSRKYQTFDNKIRKTKAYPVRFIFQINIPMKHENAAEVKKKKARREEDKDSAQRTDIIKSLRSF